MSVKVNVDNFVRAETARMFDGLGMMSGEVNKWFHFRAPTPLDKQTVIRMNRDTLYSAALADLTGGVTVTLPEAAGRYMTMMVVNEDHHINEVYDKPGAYRLSADMFGSSHVLLASARSSIRRTPSISLRSTRCRTRRRSRPVRRCRSSIPTTTRTPSTRPSKRCSAWQAG
ncbi:MAG: DUF1254 domain-containing protein [Actinomycetota bacterium]